MACSGRLGSSAGISIDPMIWASDASGAEAAVDGAAEEAAGVGRPTSAIENPGPTGPLSASTVAPIGWGAAAAGLDDGAGRLSRVGVGADSSATGRTACVRDGRVDEHTTGAGSGLRATGEIGRAHV